MAITRESLKKIGVADEHLDEIMRQYSDTLRDYIHKDELGNEVKKALGGVDPETLKTQAGNAETLGKELKKVKREYAINEYLKDKGVKGKGALKAARALFDLDKITLEGESLKGMDEQYAEITKDASVSAIFKGTTPPADPPPAPPQFSDPTGDGMTPKGDATMPNVDEINAILKNL